MAEILCRKAQVTQRWLRMTVELCMISRRSHGLGFTQRLDRMIQHISQRLGRCQKAFLQAVASRTQYSPSSQILAYSLGLTKQGRWRTRDFIVAEIVSCSAANRGWPSRFISLYS